MTTRELIRRAQALYDYPDVPRSVCRHNRKQWVRSIQWLGDKWLLAKPMERKQ